MINSEKHLTSAWKDKEKMKDDFKEQSLLIYTYSIVLSIN